MITLATLEQATALEVFQQCKEHMLKQNAKSQDVDGDTCMYRSPDGLKCPAGCLISDEEYRIQMEGKSWCSLEQIGWVPKAHAGLITSLQNIHDCCDVRKWKYHLDVLEKQMETYEFLVGVL